MNSHRFALAALVAGLVAVLPAGAAGADTSGRVGPAYSITPNGRHLKPLGRMTTVGDFPSGGALTPDGRFYWAVDSGHGRDDVQIVSVATGAVVQTLPLPGAYGAVAFAPDGRTAYVSGEPKGNSTPTGPTKANNGDAIHVFAVDPTTGQATEGDPIALPATSGGTAQTHAADPLPIAPVPAGPGPSTGLGWPIGLAVTPDGKTLVVALNQADQIAIVDLASKAARLVKVGAYPYGVAIAPGGATAYVTNELDGTVSVVDIAAGKQTGTIAVGGPDGDQESHPEGIVADPRRNRLYVGVASRDLVAIVDTQAGAVERYVSVAQAGGAGAQPVALALSPDGNTLYTADAGEDSVAAIALTRRTATLRRRRGGARRVRIPAESLIGKLPTAAYPSGVAVSPHGKLVWLAAKGLGAGPNPAYGQHFAASEAAPYGSYVIDMLLGRVGVLDEPSDSQILAATPAANAQARPADGERAPAGTPIEGANGGPSEQIKHVFYIVRENRTYDQIFGTDRRGDGDPSLELFDDNGTGTPAAGVTPNAHRLANEFPLLDHFYADSEVSVDGHIITSGAYAIDYVEKALHANYSGRGRIDEFGTYPVTLPPKGFIFDQAVRQGVSFKNYGEFSAGTLPTGDDGRSTAKQVELNTVYAYPFFFGCDGIGLTPDGTNNPLVCDTDSGTMGPAGADTTHSRFDFYQAAFNAEVAAGQVPALNYITLPNDHTNGVRQNYPTPRAMVADNDLGLGQIVDLISHSPIWKSSAIFVTEDDSQDGADHVDAHRMPAFVISPWARHGALVSHRYDQLSMLRTIELILGLKPLSLFDAYATPMYDAFDDHADTTPYTAVAPAQSLGQTTTKAPTGIDAVLPYDKLDLVPQELFDRALWHSVYGPDSKPPKPGPDASPIERGRAETALDAYRSGRSVRDALLGLGAAVDPDG